MQKMRLPVYLPWKQDIVEAKSGETSRERMKNYREREREEEEQSENEKRGK